MWSLNSNTNLLIMSFAATFFLGAAALQPNVASTLQYSYIILGTISVILAGLIFLRTIIKQPAWMRNGLNVIGLDIALTIMILIISREPICTQTGWCVQGAASIALLLSTLSLVNLVILIPSLGVGYMLQTQEQHK